jgi:hypothetical protein
MSKVKLNLRKVATGVVCLAVCMVFSTCGKDGNDGRDGANGKDGINGVNGIDGINGTDGTQGTQGIPGNAGVMMYVWNDVSFTGSNTFNISSITTGNLDKQVIVYHSDEHGTMFPIPHLAAIVGYGVFSTISFNAGGLDIGIWLANPDGTAYLDPVTWKTFRVIVVPIPEGNIIQKSAGKGYPVDWSNYKEVAAYFGLPE